MIRIQQQYVCFSFFFSVFLLSLSLLSPFSLLPSPSLSSLPLLSPLSSLLSFLLFSLLSLHSLLSPSYLFLSLFQPNTEWCTRFVNSGGLSHLLNIFLNIDASIRTQSVA